VELKSSGKEQVFKSGAQRDADENKPRPDLISPFMEERLGEWLRKGAIRYGESNWQKGIPISRCLASLCRHLMRFKQGMVDEDHLSAIIFNAMAIMHYQEMMKRGVLPKELDDLPKYENESIPPYNEQNKPT